MYSIIIFLSIKHSMYIYLLNSKLEDEIEKEKVKIYVIFATDTDGYWFAFWISEERVLPS